MGISFSFSGLLKGIFGKADSASPTLPVAAEPVRYPEFAEESAVPDRETVLQAFDTLRQNTAAPSLHITLLDERPAFAGSKVGGTPYVPTDMEIPVDANGLQLRLLAQIDCKELATLSEYPHEGLLQFWIGQDNASGLFTDGGYRVIWHPQVDASITEETVAARLRLTGDYFPVQGEFAVRFDLVPESMGMTDAHFEPQFLAAYNELTSGAPMHSLSELDDELTELLWDALPNSGHKVGGYPYFTQYDPRSEDDARTVLLLQIDSDYLDGNCKIMWGDAGVCNFFCTPEDLQKRDFSHVLYNWDCG